MTPSTKRVSHRRSLLKGVAVYRVLYQSILNAKLTGRKNLGRKRCTSNRDDRKLENTVKQSRFKHLWELHMEWTEAGVSASRVTTLRRLQEKGYQATSEPETTSEASYLGCGEKVCPKSSFQMKVNLHFIWKSRSQSLEEEWRGTESMLLEVQCEVSTVSDDLGCHVICWCWSTVFSEVHSQRSHLPGNFRPLHASFCWQALWRCWFHFPAGLGTCPHCQRYQKLVQWPWCYCAWLASKLAWPEPHRESIGKRKMRDTRSNNADELKATVKETWASIPPQQCHKLITSMPRRIEAVIKAKGAPTKYWVHIQ